MEQTKIKREKEVYYIQFFLLFCVIFEAVITVNQFWNYISNQSRKIICLADMLVNCGNHFMNSELGISLILMSSMIHLHNDFRYSNLLQYHSCKKLWNTQITKLLFYAVLYGTLYGICVFAISTQKSSIIFNWNEYESYFYVTNKITIKLEMSYIFLIYILSLILTWLLYSTIYLFFYWILRNEIVIWICIYLIRFCLNIFFHFNMSSDISYIYWSNNLIVAHMIKIIMIIIVLYIMGTRKCVKKEFYSRG